MVSFAARPLAAWAPARHHPSAPASHRL